MSDNDQPIDPHAGKPGEPGAAASGSHGGAGGRGGTGGEGVVGGPGGGGGAGGTGGTHEGGPVSKQLAIVRGEEAHTRRQGRIQNWIVLTIVVASMVLNTVAFRSIKATQTDGHKTLHSLTKEIATLQGSTTVLNNIFAVAKVDEANQEATDRALFACAAYHVCNAPVLQPLPPFPNK